MLDSLVACAFDAGAHVYSIDGCDVPSVTQVLNEERFIDFSRVPADTLDEAQRRGTYVHQVLHYYLEGDFDLDDCDPRFRGYVDSALEYLGRANKRPLIIDGAVIAIEYRFWHRARMFAGTMDYLGWDPDGVLSIDEWKTVQPSDVAAPLHLPVYQRGVGECP